MDERTRRIAAEKGIDRTIPDSGVLPSDVVDLFVAGSIPAADLLMRLRRMPAHPEPVLDVGSFESMTDLLVRYDELKGSVPRFWVIDETAGRVSLAERAGGSTVFTHTSIAVDPAAAVLAILDKVPDVPPDEGDELPTGWSKPCE